MNFKKWLTPASLVGVGKDAWKNTLGAICIAAIGSYSYSLLPALLATLFLALALLFWWLGIARKPAIAHASSSANQPRYWPYVIPSKKWRGFCKKTSASIAVIGVALIGYNTLNYSFAKAHSEKKQTESILNIDETTTQTKVMIDSFSADQNALSEQLAELNSRLKRSELYQDLSEEDIILLSRAKELGNAKARANALLIDGDYLEAEEEILKIVVQAREDLFQAQMLLGDRYFYANEYIKSIVPYQNALDERPEDVGAIINLAFAHSKIQNSNSERHTETALYLFEEALTLVSKETDPLNWALIQDYLATTWFNISPSYRVNDIERSISYNKAALEVYTPEDHPLDWARVQNNLGNSLSLLASQNREDNLNLAIACYQNALTIRTKNTYPESWAATNLNLGASWFDLTDYGHSEGYQKAIACYTSALTIFTQESHPLSWAKTQHNLGKAFSKLPTGHRDDNLKHAIERYEAALLGLSPESDPFLWAGIQNDLGIAWSKFQTGDRVSNIENAITHYQEAKETYKILKNHGAWTGMQLKLSMLYVELNHIKNSDS